MVNSKPEKPYGPFVDRDYAIDLLAGRGVKDEQSAAIVLKNDIDEYWRTRQSDYVGEPATPTFTGDMLDCVLAATDKFAPSPAYLDLVCQHPMLSARTQEYLAGLFVRVQQTDSPSVRFPVKGSLDAEFCMRCLISNPNLASGALDVLRQVPEMSEILAHRLDVFPEVVSDIIGHLGVVNGPDLIETLFGLLSYEGLSEWQRVSVVEQMYQRWDDVEKSGRVFERSVNPRPSDVDVLVDMVSRSGVLSDPALADETRSFFIVRAATFL